MSKHNVIGYELTGAEFDVFYKLYWFGPQEDGDLPSKAGMSDLIDKGLAEKTNEEKRNRLTVKGTSVANKHWEDY